MSLAGLSFIWTRRGFLGGVAVAARGTFAPRCSCAPAGSPGGCEPTGPAVRLPARPDAAARRDRDARRGTAPGSCSSRRSTLAADTSSASSGRWSSTTTASPSGTCPCTSMTAIDLRVQRYRGHPHADLVRGRRAQGLRRHVRDLRQDVPRGREGRRRQRPARDLHEFLITSRDTALISVYEQVTADLTSVGGSVDGQLVSGSSRRSTSRPARCCSSGELRPRAGHRTNMPR